MIKDYLVDSRGEIIDKGIRAVMRSVHYLKGRGRERYKDPLS